jgi:hypothetical protein
VIALLILAALLGWGLERNHRRQTWPSTSGIARNGVPDRDVERVIADLRALG